MNHSNLFLIGPMGVGKTTVGNDLAAKLSKQFFDSDLEIERVAGVKIPLIFKSEGEAGFRRLENNVIAKLVHNKNIVLATGGGSVLDKDNRVKLANNGLVIHLKAKLEQLVLRIKSGSERPLIKLDQNIDNNMIAKILCEREPLYTDIADASFDTSDRSLAEVVNSIYEYYIKS